MLAVRFALEVFGWVGLGVWGWSVGNGGFIGGLVAMSFIAISATAWGVFRVPNDPPGKLHPPVRVTGWIRLVIELMFFGLAATGLWSSGHRAAAETLLTAVTLLYVVTWDRQRWLVRQ
jgi:hypothetical protein